MTNITRERLLMSIQTVKDNIKILEEQKPEDAGYYLQLEHEKHILELLQAEADGKIIVAPCKPMPVMSDGNPFNSDVYCPFCGVNLSGLYGDEPTLIIQCYNCGKFLDNKKSITREEAEKALKERETE